MIKKYKEYKNVNVNLDIGKKADEISDMFALSEVEFFNKYIHLSERDKMGVIGYAYGFINGVYKAFGYDKEIIEKITKYKKVIKRSELK